MINYSNERIKSINCITILLKGKVLEATVNVLTDLIDVEHQMKETALLKM